MSTHALTERYLAEDVYEDVGSLDRFHFEKRRTGHGNLVLRLEQKRLNTVNGMLLQVPVTSSYHSLLLGPRHARK